MPGDLTILMPVFNESTTPEAAMDGFRVLGTLVRCRVM